VREHVWHFNHRKVWVHALMSTLLTENSDAPGARESLPKDVQPQCSECPVARFGIYQSTMTSSPEKVTGLRTKVVSYQPHRTILHEGQSSEDFGSIRSGWAYAFTQLPDRRRHIQGFMIPGDTVVLDLLNIGPFPISFGVKALTDATVCWFPAPHMRKILFSEPAQRRETQYWMAYYWTSLNHRAAAIARSDARSKVAHFFVEMLGRLRHRGLVKDDGFEFFATQEQIGDCLGLTSVYINRMLSHLKQRGILEIGDKTLRVFDEQALIAIAEEKH
jgi:CRP/FNR family transcriptional regulator